MQGVYVHYRHRKDEKIHPLHWFKNGELGMK